MVETFILNFLRGTGINGLKGIPEKKAAVVRPLLTFKKEEILEFAVQNGIRYRVDKSNLEDKYNRNFIRLNVIPELKKLNPDLETTFIKNLAHLKQEAAIVSEYYNKRRKEICSEKSEQISVSKVQLKKENYKESFLNFLLHPYGFNATQQQNILINIVNNQQIGKRFNSKEYELVIGSSEIIIKPKQQKRQKESVFGSLSELHEHSLFKISKLTSFVLPKKNELLINQQKLIFPLTIRTKKTGDKFKPFGMKGFKLLSNFFKDEKLNAFERENCILLINGNSEIIWVCGYRSDDRYKVSNKDSNLIKIIYGA